MVDYARWGVVPAADNDLTRHCVITDIQFGHITSPLINIHLFIDPYRAPNKNCYSMVNSGVNVPVLIVLDNYEDGRRFPRKGNDTSKLYKRISDYWYDPMLNRLGRLCDIQKFFLNCDLNNAGGLHDVFLYMDRMYQAVADHLDRLYTLASSIPISYEEPVFHTKQEALRDIKSLYQQCEEGEHEFNNLVCKLKMRAGQPRKFVDFDFIFG